MSINKAIILGNLGADPELRTTGGGTPVCELRIATNSRTKDRDGNWTDKVTWHSVTCFGKTAEVAAKYLRKGGPVAIDGRMETDSWDDRETGKKRYKTYVVCERLHLVGGKGDNNHPDVQRNSGGRGNASGAGGASYKDEEIPF